MVPGGCQWLGRMSGGPWCPGVDQMVHGLGRGGESSSPWSGWIGSGGPWSEEVRTTIC